MKQTQTPSYSIKPCGMNLLFCIAGAEIDACDKMGNTPLHIAARYGHELMIHTLIENDVNAQK